LQSRSAEGSSIAVNPDVRPGWQPRGGKKCKRADFNF
jgi:hypothetical protein